ncbi:MAG: sodium:solute symporter family protein [Cyanobacteriota bacterium]|nr:sodium:solute symporter family protein [Cyanobacteriota bacterium]MEC7896084.1 sodium:solute symporter family protein [Cyanobacteriota bacterium]MEC8096459.1 sodium:solute symporter family protein [Cyanobacteriota bacterium]|tara:strand:- start:5555 stop:6982 length:1428 start_codon:yes stop_codon:yes gene_type:complete
MAGTTPFLAPGIAWALVVLFSVLWVALGVAWGRRGKGDADDYMLAGRNIGLALSTATLMASWVTGNTTLLAPEFGYRTGLWGMFSYGLAGLGLILFAPLALRIKQLMPHGRTSGDFIRLRYGRLAWWVFMVITAIYTLGFLMTQAMGAGLLLQALSGFDYHVGMVVVIGVATLYTLYGGMRAVIGTDFIQSLLIMVLLAVVAVLAFRQSPMPEVHAALVNQHPDRLDLLLPAGLLLAWNSALFSMGEVFHNNIWWSRVFASRRGVVMTSFVLGGLAWMSVPLVTGSIGLVALARDLPLQQVNMVFPVMAADLLGAGGAALVFVVVFASLTSTLDSLLASTADLLAEDVYFRLLRPRASDAQLKQAARMMVVGLAVVTLALSWPQLDSLASVLLFTGSLVASTVWPVACGLYWRSASRGAAILAMLSGSLVGLAAYVLIEPYCAAVFSAAISALVMLVGSHLWPERFDFALLKEDP